MLLVLLHAYCDVTHVVSSLATECVFVVVWDSDVVRLQEYITFIAAIVNILNFIYVSMFDILNEFILFENTLNQ